MADDIELDAMKKIAAAALEPLEESARHRALQWAASRFRSSRPLDGGVFVTASRSVELDRDDSMGSPLSKHSLIGFEAANPKTEREKALIAAYWTQVCQNVASFAACDAEH